MSHLYYVPSLLLMLSINNRGILSLHISVQNVTARLLVQLVKRSSTVNNIPLTNSSGTTVSAAQNCLLSAECPRFAFCNLVWSSSYYKQSGGTFLLYQKRGVAVIVQRLQRFRRYCPSVYQTGREDESAVPPS